MTTISKSVLLIVDDESSVCRALTRILSGKVGEIWTATNPAEAETILETRNVTHLICDHWFGPGQAVGTDLVDKWKRAYPSLKRAVVLTGTDVAKLEAPEGVDEVLSKVIDPVDLLRALELP